MLRKIMLYLMGVETVSKLVVLAAFIWMNFERLPAAIYVSTGILVLCGIILLCRNLKHHVSSKGLAIFYLLGILSVVFNLIFMKITSRAEVTMLDFLLIGTIMDLVVNATLIVMTVKERKYIRIKIKSDR